MQIIRGVLVFCFMSVYSLGNDLYATVQWGNVGQYLIPISSATVPLLLKDTQGFVQMGLATGLVQGATVGLKLAIHERRPNGLCCASFPSGHASMAFTGASFIQFRYGFKYSIPFYLGSFFVAYSRVNHHDHYPKDVVFGAGLAILGTYLSTTPYNGKPLSFVVGDRFAGVIYRKFFH